MKGDVTTSVEGLRDLEKGFFELSHFAARGVGRRALKQAGQPVADLANANAPVDPESGDRPLSDSYAVSTRLNKNQGRAARAFADVVMFIGSVLPNKAVQQEFGNRRHAAQPHFRPAWDAEAVPTLNRIVRFLTVELEKSVARARRKAARQSGK